MLEILSKLYKYIIYIYTVNVTYKKHLNHWKIQITKCHVSRHLPIITTLTMIAMMMMKKSSLADAKKTSDLPPPPPPPPPTAPPEVDAVLIQ